MLVVVGLKLARGMLVIVWAVLAPMLVIVHIVPGIMGMLVRVRVFVRMAVLMRVLMGVRDAIVRVFVRMRVLVRMVVIMGVFVLSIHNSPRA
jgi:hypothetical protein